MLTLTSSANERPEQGSKFDPIAETLRRWSGDADWAAGELLQLALMVRPRGAVLIPLDDRKRPLCDWKRWQTEAPDDQDISAMFAEAARRARARNTTVAGVGLIPGSARLAVRDFDDPDAYSRWVDRFPDLARVCPTVKTGRGYHVYVRLPVPHRLVHVGRDRLGDGELIADHRHLVVVPPSRHPSGGTYRWVGRPPRLDDFPVIAPADAGFCTGYGLRKRPDTQTTRPAAEDGPNQRRQAGNAVIHPACVKHSSPEPSDIPEAMGREAILASVPSGPGQRNDAIWSLARRLKATPHLADADPRDLEPHVRFWFQLALPVITTQSFRESFTAFVSAWQRVQVPHGRGIRAAAAAAVPLLFPDVPGRRPIRDRPSQLLVGLCHELARSSSKGEFFLSGRTAARECGFGTHVTAASRLNDLVAAGTLELVRKGSQKSGASVYRLVSVPAGSLAPRPEPEAELALV
ncbi:MAG: bifunctional DNA primase/polymerase [Gemmataceae bacterium]